MSQIAKGKYKYWISPEGLLQLEAWARDGLIDEQIAHNMDIAPSTLYAWKKDYPEISESLKKGKAVIDIQVENALIKRALGYEYDEVKEKYEYGDCTEKTITKKHIVPDTTAQIFWLKNRKFKEWGGQQQSKLNVQEVDQNDPSEIRDIMLAVVQMVAAGDMDLKMSNSIISACNSILTAIRTDEQEKKIDELEKILKSMKK